MITNIESEVVTREQAEKWGPLYVKQEMPTFKNITEGKAWADVMEDRFLNGYNGLTGEHVEYLQEFKIKDGYGKGISPMWRDVDHFVVYPMIEKCEKLEQDDFTLKRREFGYSSIAAYRGVKKAIRYPGSVSNFTSYSEAAMRKLMTEKVKFIAENAYGESEASWKKQFGQKQSLWMPESVKWNESGCFVKISIDGEVSRIQGVQTSNGVKSAKNMEGDRLVYAFIDEFFLHEFATKVRNSADSSRKMGFRNVGRLSLGGSAGDASEDGAARAQEIWYNHDKMGINIVFVPGWMGIASAPIYDQHGVPTGKFMPLMVNGWSLKAESELWIDETRKILKSLRDKSAYWQFVKAYPKSVDEIFETTTGGSWSQDERERFENQKKKVYMSTTYKFEPYNLYTLPDGKTQKVKATNSPIKILEDPQPGVVYIAGTDPTPISSRKESDDLSEYAIAIMREDQEKIVAYYKERSKDASRLVGNSIKLQKMYNNAPTMLERNRGDAIIIEYERLGLGLGKLLLPEPAPFRPQNAKNIEPGYAKSIHNADVIDHHFLTWARSFNEVTLQGGIEGMWGIEIIDECINHDIGNRDLADAIKGCTVELWWRKEKLFRRMSVNEAKANSKQVLIHTMENGMMVTKLVDVSAVEKRLGPGFKALVRGRR
jgi:hypothetical protein